jgi:hypothetical protein
MIVGGAAMLFLAGVAVTLWLMNRRAERAAETPAWTDPQQPAGSVAADLAPLTPEQSWAANRARPPSCSSTVRTAGMRSRKSYDHGTLAESPTSIIRSAFDLDLRLDI